MRRAVQYGESICQNVKQAQAAAIKTDENVQTHGAPPGKNTDVRRTKKEGHFHLADKQHTRTDA